jgi:phospholipase C
MRTNPKIEHIVVLMMENRSFDHLLGFTWNPGIDGVTPGEYSNLDKDGEPHAVTDGAQYQGQLVNDPGHDFEDVYLQMYGVPAGTPAGEPTMSGFAQSYQEHGGGPADIMRCFRPDQVPVLSALGRQYAVCDRWFSSVPGPTLPNRAFAHFGTSFGRLDMDPVYFGSQPSIYQRMYGAGATAMIYYYANWSGTMGLTFLLNDQDGYFGLWGDFLNDCKKNQLPQYAFIEPPYYDHEDTLAGDQHPDHNIQVGDNFIRQVYNAIRSNNDTWHSTLLLIVWDEHGGIFDHVAPPAVPQQNQDGHVSTAPPFNFDRYGVRVPAVVVSPYIQKGTVSHTLFEHASIPATAAAQFIGTGSAISNRERYANTLLALLDATILNDDQPDFSAQPAVPAGAVSSAGNDAAQLHLDHVAEVHRVLQTADPALAAQMDPTAVRTEQDASQFVEKAMTSIHPAGAAAATPQVQP